jgi:4-carboxymuconolactone decarboxylase
MESCFRSECLSNSEEVEKKAPRLIKKYFSDNDTVFNKGELTQREKALIALAVAHAMQCPYCMDTFNCTCLEKGSNIKEITEAVQVANTVRSGAALVKRVQLRSKFDGVYVF